MNIEMRSNDSLLGTWWEMAESSNDEVIEGCTNPERDTEGEKNMISKDHGGKKSGAGEKKMDL